MTRAQLLELAQKKRAELDALNAKIQAAETVGDDDLIKAEALRKEHDELLASAARMDALTSGLPEQGRVVNRIVQASVVKENIEDDPKRGFKSHLEFLGAVIDAGKGKRVDERLRSLTAGSDEHGEYTDTYGGYLIPEAFLPGLKEVAWEGDPTAGRTQNIPMTAPIVKIPARVDKNHSSSVTGGFVAYRRAETKTVSASRGAIELIELKADELMGVAYATEELLQDSPLSFAAIIDAGLRTQFASKISDEKISGTGVAQYLGVLNSPCLIEVAKEDAQTADTITSTNVIAMRARCWGYQNAIWLANNDTYPQAVKLYISVTTGALPIFVPGNGTDVPDTLLGRPIVFTDEVSKLGDKGDIILGNWGEYLEGTYKPIQSASSVHVRFLENETTFKVWMRNCGAPWWKSALQPKNSSATRSPFVTLAERT